MLEKSAHFPYQLSIGEQQRVAVARSLARSPTLLLADEPTGSLDRPRSRQVIDLLIDLATREGRTIVVVSHDGEIVASFRRIVPMSELARATCDSGGCVS